MHFIWHIELVYLSTNGVPPRRADVRLGSAQPVITEDIGKLWSQMIQQHCQWLVHY